MKRWSLGRIQPSLPRAELCPVDRRALNTLRKLLNSKVRNTGLHPPMTHTPPHAQWPHMLTQHSFTLIGMQQTLRTMHTSYACTEPATCMFTGTTHHTSVHTQHQHATYISNTCVQTQHCTYMRVTYTCAHTILTYTHIHVYTTTTCPPIHPYTQLHTCTHTLPGWAHHPTLDPEQKWGLQV
jgi:hypothetical protein